MKNKELGLTLEKIKEISKIKNEPKWMLDFRINAYNKFKDLSNPIFGPDLHIDFDKINFYKSIENIDNDEKHTNGTHMQIDSKTVYHKMIEELEKKKVVFCDTDTALRKHPELFKEYFNTLVKYDENKYTALNGAVWSGGIFMYIPPFTKLDKPLQSYFKINSKNMGQFVRNLIIVDEGSDVYYMEGNSAKKQSSDALHNAVVEVFVKKKAKCRYTTLQNWSNNIYNLTTKRAKVEEAGLIEWIECNIGSKINMKYPSSILAGPYAKGNAISIAIASNNQFQDIGAKMIHLAPFTESNIISKLISANGGTSNYRGTIKISKEAPNSKSTVKCDTIIIDRESKSDTIPVKICENNTSQIKHEASVSKINDEKLFCLMSRGLNKDKATELLITGFIKQFKEELPNEYVSELNLLLKNYF